jgi:hypothetical protein
MSPTRVFSSSHGGKIGRLVASRITNISPEITRPFTRSEWDDEHYRYKKTLTRTRNMFFAPPCPLLREVLIALSLLMESRL